MSQTQAPVSAVWTVDPIHTDVEFAVKHMMIATAKGRFNKVSGRIVGDPADLTTATIESSIDASSVDTHEPQRDAHLRSADFFDVENHPEIRFQSKHIERSGQDRYRVVGELTIRGITQEVELDSTLDGRIVDPYGKQRVAFTAETRVNRKDFGLHWNSLLEAGGVMVGDDVRITIHIEAVQEG